MTAMLASVCNLEEAELISGCRIDILDLKDPQSGALGALPAGMVDRIVNYIDGRIPVSATVGDVPYRADILYPLINMMSATGVDIVKVGVFGDVLDSGVMDMLSDFSSRDVRIVLVLFAEDMPPGPDFAGLALTGISGVMIDTRDKLTGPLRGKISDARLAGLVSGIRHAGLLCGLAGSLRRMDVIPLLQLNPDFLGFRGALCHSGQRDNGIDVESVARLRALIPPEIASFLNKAAVTA